MAHTVAVVVVMDILTADIINHAKHKHILKKYLLKVNDTITLFTFDSLANIVLF